MEVLILGAAGMVASEIISCLKFDCNFLKLFPAEPLGGISYLNSLSGPFPNVSFCPTGGINSGNYLSWLSQKNVLCVGGSWIAPKNDNNYDKIKKRALEVLKN